MAPTDRVRSAVAEAFADTHGKKAGSQPLAAWVELLARRLKLARGFLRAKQAGAHGPYLGEQRHTPALTVALLAACLAVALPLRQAAAWGATGHQWVSGLAKLLPGVLSLQAYPAAKTHILCGAIVPMNGQSGGSVEVMFDQGAKNSVPFAPTVVPPL